DDETARLTPADLARLAGAAIGAVGDLAAYGFVTSGVTEIAVASTRGVAARQRLTDLTALVLAAGEETSGYADATSRAAGRVDPAEVAREAAAKAARTRGATTIEPGPFRAVLEPYAVGELLQ